MKQRKSTVRKQRLFPRTLGETIGQLTKPIMKKHGLPDGLVQVWPHIAGSELASYCTPVACKRSKKAAAATLIIEVLPSHALVAQHAVGVMVEKINLHYGYQVVERIQFKPAVKQPLQAPYHPSHEQQTMHVAFDELAQELKKG